MDGKQGIEQVGQLDATSLGNQAEKCAVPVEAPRLAVGGDLQAGLSVWGRSGC